MPSSPATTDASPGSSSGGGFGWAWIVLSVSLALHVIDEAMRDFLSLYNPTVLAIRERFPFFPLPVFTFQIWLSGLIGAAVARDLALCIPGRKLGPSLFLSSWDSYAE